MTKINPQFKHIIISKADENTDEDDAEKHNSHFSHNSSSFDFLSFWGLEEVNLSLHCLNLSSVLFWFLLPFLFNHIILIWKLIFFLNSSTMIYKKLFFVFFQKIIVEWVYFMITMNQNLISWIERLIYSNLFHIKFWLSFVLFFC